MSSVSNFIFFSILRLMRKPIVAHSSVIASSSSEICVSFESSAYLNLGYKFVKELGPGEIVSITPDEVVTLKEPEKEMKICSFLCAGAFMHQTGKSYVYEMDGMGRRMPIVFGCFTVSALGLMGVPGLAGFISKWNLTAAAVESGNKLSYFGIVCLLISALLTAIYMLNIVVRAYFPGCGFNYDAIKTVKDPGWKMCLPLLICAVGVICLGLCSGRLVQFFADVAAGLY